MRKSIIFLSLIFIISKTEAAAINFLCPDGSTMHQGTSCAPDAGCHPNGVYFKIDGLRISANIDNNGTVNIDDAFINKKVNVESGNNFWSPPYCKNIGGSGYLFGTFTLEKMQTIRMEFHTY